MALLDTRETKLSEVLLFEDHKDTGYCRAVVVANEAAPLQYVIGTVLGKVTATGKYQRLEATAVDGSQNFAGIYIGNADVTANNLNEQTIAATTDTNVVVLYRGPAAIGASNLVFGASVDTAPEIAAVVAQMEAVGIQVLTQQ